jgi:FkbM family methyltransferase
MRLHVMMGCAHSLLPGELVDDLVLKFFRKVAYYLFSILELMFGFENPLLIIRIFLGLSRPGLKTLRLRQNGLQFKVRSAMDVWSIKETFLDKFYERFGFPIQAGWKVVDIGGGTGEFVVFAACALAQSQGQVVAFEPFPESFILMGDNINLNKLNNVQILNQAIGPETGELGLDLAGGEPLQFQSHPKQITDSTNSLRVESISLAGALRVYKVEMCDLLKLDCEGAEYSILFSTPPSTLKHIMRIVMEYHDNVTQYNHLDLVRFLNGQGYRVETFPNPVHSHLGYMRAIRQ